MILDKMCWEFCTYLHTGHLYHYKPSTHPTLKSMWFTQEQKQTWTLYFFGGGGGGGGGEWYNNIHFFLTFLYNIGKSKKQLNNKYSIYMYVKGYIIKGR